VPIESVFHQRKQHGKHQWKVLAELHTVAISICLREQLAKNPFKFAEGQTRPENVRCLQVAYFYNEIYLIITQKSDRFYR
jgi:hypothetical protein